MRTLQGQGSFGERTPAPSVRNQFKILNLGEIPVQCPGPQSNHTGKGRASAFQVALSPRCQDVSPSPSAPESSGHLSQFVATLQLAVHHGQAVNKAAVVSPSRERTPLLRTRDFPRKPRFGGAGETTGHPPGHAASPHSAQPHSGCKRLMVFKRLLRLTFPKSPILHCLLFL